MMRQIAVVFFISFDFKRFHSEKCPDIFERYLICIMIKIISSILNIVIHKKSLKS